MSNYQPVSNKPAGVPPPPLLLSGKETDTAAKVESPPLPRPSAYIRLLGWMVSVILITFCALAVGGFWLYEQKVTQRVVDARPCGLKTEKMELTGVREYSYLNNSLFQYNWHDRSKVNIQTRINVPFDGITVVAIQADTTYEVLNRGEGEGGVLSLPPAHHYVFYSKGNVAAITDTAICK